VFFWVDDKGNIFVNDGAFEWADREEDRFEKGK
jgi:hypothetical protein